GDDSSDVESTASKLPASAGNHMHLAIPVIGLNQIIGVLFVEQSTQPFEEPYDEQSLRLLSVVAAQLGSYLTSLQLRQEDIEHARQLAIALRQLEETDRRKDDFLAMLGHELRNPIGAINNALRIIDHGAPVDAARYHQLIDRQIRHLSRIVDDLLDASRVRLGKIALDCHPIDLRNVAERWLEAFAQTALVQSHALRLHIPDAPVAVRGDTVRLEQIFSNLLTNALKYTPPSGQIDVTVGTEAGHGVIRVRDDGIGMDGAVLATVFDLFTQADESLSRSQGGLGLGLPLVRSLVEQHGGTVQAVSEGLGFGSEFIVRIPLTSEQLPSSAAREPALLRAPAAQPLRVLIIEDNEDACETLQAMLRLWGHEVDCAVDGMAGMARAIRERPDVMLVDIGLPKLDGYEVARRTRLELGAATPTLIAMTGYGQPEDRRRAIDAGFDAHMVKPVNAVELQRLLGAIKPLPTRVVPR
ncbi:MAG: response regulator, partial [Myxococcales bacterium]|nr:response regulator [Myxococcales bacterium]